MRRPARGCITARQRRFRDSHQASDRRNVIALTPPRQRERRAELSTGEPLIEDCLRRVLWNGVEERELRHQSIARRARDRARAAQVTAIRQRHRQPRFPCLDVTVRFTR